MTRGLGIFFGLAIFSSAAFSETSQRHSKGLVIPADAEYGVPFLSWSEIADLPDTVDLRESGLVSPVKNQANCGSCWAFAGAAVMESAMLRANGEALNLAEQELVSCDKTNYGCKGGWQPFEYMKNHGIGLEEDFPYAAKNLSCKKIEPAAKVLRWGNIGTAQKRPSVDEVRKAINDLGALWVSVAADTSWDNPTPINIRCSNASPNHAVTLVGYEKSTDDKFNFVVKNSWGAKWNGSGFIKSQLGCDNLGRHVSFVVPADHACSPPEFGLGKKLILKGGGELKAPGLDHAGLPYDWFRVGQQLPIGQPRRVGPRDSGDYIVRTHNACGNWEMMVNVKTF